MELKSATAEMRLELERRARSRKDWEECRCAAEPGVVSRKARSDSFVIGIPTSA